ncbi:MAG: hypothetical protein M3N15_01795 [Actinomycetota bacterium]|nr:hypothetical protein [Actinomycetota bacterium]
MAKGGSFWSTIPGLLTGLAGVLTAGVTLVTLAVSQGWVGDGSGEDATAGSTTGPAAGTRGGAGGGATGSALELGVEPTTLRFRPALLTAATETVTVRNEGDVPFTVDAPQLSGDDPESFDVDDGGCAGRSLASGRSCELSVTFDPNGVDRATAKLVVSVNGEEDNEEVTLEAVGAG